MLLRLSFLKSHNDQDFLEELYKTYRHDMFKAAYFVVHNQYDAEDAIHNAVVSIDKNISVVRQLDENKRKAYVCRAARNHAINICAKQQRDRQLAISLEQVPLLFEDPRDLLDEICCGEIAQKAKDCILTLPLTYRDILYLYYVENMNGKQIAITLGLKSATVRQRLHRGRKLLIEKISETGGNANEE